MSMNERVVQRYLTAARALNDDEYRKAASEVVADLHKTNPRKVEQNIHNMALTLKDRRQFQAASHFLDLVEQYVTASEQLMTLAGGAYNHAPVAPTPRGPQKPAPGPKQNPWTKPLG